MSITITQTKIILPRRRPDIISRPRLLNMLDDLLDYRLTLVTAPAGYGKTALLVDLAHEVEFPVCWYALDPLDQDLKRFLTHFIAAIRNHFPQFGAHSLSLVNNINQSETDFSRLVRTFVNDAYRHIEEHFAIVLDDYHLIDQSHPINVFLSQFGQEVDENCHLVIASRTLLDLPDLPLMVGRSQVKGLSFEELAFQPHEIQRLMKKNYQQEISKEQAEKLVSETEGWITGLLLSAETMMDELDDRSRATRATGINLYDYLAEQVLDNQPRTIRDFLLATSQMDEFNAEICQAVLGAPPQGTSWSELMNTILHNHLFVLPVENGGTWIRYHHLFQHFLQERMKKERPAQRQQLLQRLKDYYLDRSSWEKAYHYAQKLNNPHLVAELLEKAGGELMKDGRMKQLQTWIDALPEQVLVNHPALLSRYGAVASVLENPRLGLNYLEEAEQIFSDQDSPLDRARNLVWQASAHHFLGHHQKSLQKAELALELMDEKEPTIQVRAQAEKAAGLALFRQGKIDQANRSLQRAADLYHSIDDEKDAALVTMDLGLINMEAGYYQLASRYYQKALTTWEETERIFKDMGVDRVYPADVKLTRVIEDLEADCLKRKALLAGSAA